MARLDRSTPVGEYRASVAAVAREFGIGWRTAMGAVREQTASPRVDDPVRFAGGVAAVGGDETIGLLAWLAQRGVALETTTQHDLGTWFATGPSTRRHAVRFLHWAQEKRLLRNVTVRPAASPGNGPALSATQRLEHLRRVLRDETMQPAHPQRCDR